MVQKVWRADRNGINLWISKQFLVVTDGVLKTQRFIGVVAPTFIRISGGVQNHPDRQFGEVLGNGQVGTRVQAAHPAK